jgi:hypothetical protein
VKAKALTRWTANLPRIEVDCDLRLPVALFHLVGDLPNRFDWQLDRQDAVAEAVVEENTAEARCESVDPSRVRMT